MTTVTASQFFGGNAPPAPSAVTTDLKASAASAETQAQQDNSAFGIAKNTALGVGKALLNDVVETGKNLGQSLAAGDVTKNLTEGDTGLKDTALRVLKQIHTDQSAGKDTSRLEQAYNGIAAHSQENDLANILPTLNKSNLQAVLEAVGVGSDALVGGAGKPVAAGAEAAINLGADAAKVAATNVGAGLKAVGEKATGLGVSMEVPTRQALQTYQAAQPTLFGRVKNLVTGAKAAATGAAPTTEANTAVRLLQPGTEWQLGVHAKRVAGDLWQNTIAPSLAGTKDAVHMPTFFGGLRKQIISDTPDLSRRSTLLNALSSFQEDFGKVSNVGYLKLQAYKEGWAKFVPEKAYKGQPIAGALNEVRALAAQKARTIIYTKLGSTVKQAYIDYGNLKSIQEAGIKSVDALRSKGVTKQVWEFVMDKAVTPIATTAGKVLYKTGDGLEFLGSSGAKKVRDIVQPR